MPSWWKNLSTTDAQQQTTGGLVPYLRLTSSSLATGNFQTWFRQSFFSCCSWHPGYFNNKPVEEAYVDPAASINSNHVGMPLTLNEIALAFGFELLCCTQVALCGLHSTNNGR